MRIITEKIKYIRGLFAPEDKLFQDINKKLKEIKREIQIGAEEAKILQFLIKVSNAKKIVEVGTLAGYSSIAMAKALPKDGKIYTIEKDPEMANIARGFFQKSSEKEKIQLIEGNGTEKLEELSNKAPFDMIFIDADKGGYVKYLNWAEKNIKSGGVIIGDNSFLFGAVYAEKLPKNVSQNSLKTMQEFNKRLANSKKYHGIMIPSQEGMTIAIKK